MSFENELLDFIMFEEITGGLDEEDKETLKIASMNYLKTMRFYNSRRNKSEIMVKGR